MADERNPWQGAIQSINQDSGRLLGMMLALAADVYMLKAEVSRLRIALAHKNVMEPADLTAAADSADFAAWDRKERSLSVESLLEPWLHPDKAPDLLSMMLQEESATAPIPPPRRETA
ncbi:MAG: hypothetical protein AB7G13_34500 [Lautropia sp.]